MFREVPNKWDRMKTKVGHWLQLCLMTMSYDSHRISVYKWTPHVCLGFLLENSPGMCSIRHHILWNSLRTCSIRHHIATSDRFKASYLTCSLISPSHAESRKSSFLALATRSRLELPILLSWGGHYIYEFCM
jgi:hypothetical protein